MSEPTKDDDIIHYLDNATCYVVRTSQLTGKRHGARIKATREQVQAWLNGEFIQNAFPHLPAEEREFLKTGITPEEWREAFPPEEEDQ